MDLLQDPGTVAATMIVVLILFFAFWAASKKEVK